MPAHMSLHACRPRCTGTKIFQRLRCARLQRFIVRHDAVWFHQKHVGVHLHKEYATSRAPMQKETLPLGKGAQEPTLLCQRRPASELTYKQ